MSRVAEWAVMYLKSSLNEWSEASARCLNDDTFYNISLPISGHGGLFLPSRSCKRDAIICRQTGKLPWKPSVSLSLFSLFLFLRVGVSITAALRAQWNHLGSLSNPYSCLGGVSQTGESWRRCTGHKDETAAPCLKIAQIISSTHVSIEAAVAMETHPPSASSSSTER